jgi:antitoxin (DNA-binding transcriptional repressor) of toxin-antitoxin stability system
MPSIDISDVTLSLKDLVARLEPGEPLTLVDHDVPVAIVSSAPKVVKPQFGSCRGMLTIISEDDEHLQDFAEYLP